MVSSYFLYVLYLGMEIRKSTRVKEQNMSFLKESFYKECIAEY